jgi:hypothetical protein
VLATLGDIATNLVAAAIGAVALLAWQKAASRHRFRGSRKFWKPFVSGDCICVTGNVGPVILSEHVLGSVDEAKRAHVREMLPSLRSYIGDQELSGLMGRGDHDAIVQLQAGLARIGMAATIPEFAGRPSGAELEKNLIAVGGPDVNPLTMSLLDRLPVKLVIAKDSHGHNVVRDLVHDQDYAPRSDREASVVRDYGIVVRAANPYDRSKSVLILAGAHGFGSLAAAVAVFREDQFDQRLTGGASAGLECLVCHERDGDRENAAQRSSIVFVRDLVS